jgi:ketosteroid isomerase-like protein
MSTQENILVVKNAFAAIGRGDLPGLLALTADDLTWVIPGEWILAGTHHGHAGLTDFFQKASAEVDISYPRPPEFIAQDDRVVLVGVANGTINATQKTFVDRFVFVITVRDGKMTHIEEYIDTLALARASSGAQ